MLCKILFVTANLREVRETSGGSSLEYMGGGDKRFVRDHALLDHALFPRLKHFLPEETPLVSQEMSFKCEDLDNVHTPPPPRSFLIRFSSRTNFLKKLRGTSPPHSPLAPPLRAFSKVWLKIYKTLLNYLLQSSDLLYGRFFYQLTMKKVLPSLVQTNKTQGR